MLTYDKPEISKKIPIAALLMSFLSIALLISGRLIDMTSNSSAYTRDAEFTRHVSTVIVIAFALISLVGLLLSVIALINVLRKPAVYGGKAIAIVALVLNALFSLISISTMFILLSSATRYLSNR